MNSPRFIALAGCLTLGLFEPVFGQGAPAEEPPVVLPPFEVEGKFPADGWVYARVGNTEFLSQLSARVTRAYLDDFVIFQDFVRAQYPEAALPSNQPVTVVLCGNSEAFRQFGGKPDATAGRLPDSDRFILIDDSQIDARASTMAITRLLRRRWVNLALKQQPLPLWQKWATRELLVALEIREAHLEMGLTPFQPRAPNVKLLPSPMGGGPRPFTFSAQFNLQPGGLPPFGEIFSLTEPVPEQFNSWSAMMQATAFSHMCQFSTRHRRWREPYQKFVTRLKTEPFSETLFAECFGKSTKDMNWILRDYLFTPGIKYESRRYQFPPTAPFEVREALPVEVLRLLREAQRLTSVAETTRSR